VKLSQGCHRRTFQRTPKISLPGPLRISWKYGATTRPICHAWSAGLRERSHNEHSTTTRAIRHAQSEERLAQTHVGISPSAARTPKHEHWKSENGLFFQIRHFWILQGVAPDGSFTNRDFRTFQNIVQVHMLHLLRTWPPKPLSTHVCQHLRAQKAPHPPREWKQCPMSCVCHAKRRSRLQNATDIAQKPNGAPVKVDLRKGPCCRNPSVWTRFLGNEKLNEQVLI
jgi:hypothetical protein